MKYNYNFRNEAGEFAPKVLTVGGSTIINPTAEMYAEAGYLPYTPPTPTEEEEREQARIASISMYKQQLADSDYKVIKMAECAAVGAPLPYDAEELHQERQALRDMINQLEEP